MRRSADLFCFRSGIFARHSPDSRLAGRDLPRWGFSQQRNSIAVIADWKKTPGTVGIRIMLNRAPDDPGVDQIHQIHLLWEGQAKYDVSRLRGDAGL
jgi:hypothetical protein